MAGHSKWKNIQHRKNRQDVKRGKDFAKAAKDIIIAAKSGGDPVMNVRLRAAILAAKAANLPKDKIESAIKKGTGELPGGDIIEITYEGCSPEGIAVLIEAATDNRNRTAAEMRRLLSKHGWAMGEAGSVVWMFSRKGIFVFNHAKCTEDQLLELSLEAGAEEVVDHGDVWRVHTAPEDFETVQQAFSIAALVPDSAKITMEPKSLVVVDVDSSHKLFRFMVALNEHEDVQDIITNVDLSDEFLSGLESRGRHAGVSA